jgi:subtilisin family serine protease
MRRLLTTLLVLGSLSAGAKPLVVAVIDTGIDKNIPHLCKSGHKTFIKPTPFDSSSDPVKNYNPLVDNHGHGSNIAGLINRNAGDGDYCILSLQYYKNTGAGFGNLTRLREAIRYAIDVGVDFINYSGGGGDSNEAEHQLIVEALNKGITVVVAAGNESSDLDKECDYYPACYNDKRLVVVGNLLRDSEHKCYPDEAPLTSDKTKRYPLKAPSSNYGKRVNRWEVGTSCNSDAPDGKMARMSGTSQATAVATGKLLRDRLHRVK